MKYLLYKIILLYLLNSSDSFAQRIEVDLELVLAIDASRSIDVKEHEYQLAGIAAAFRSQAFLRVMRYAEPKGIAVTLVEWSDILQGKQLIEWSHISDENSANTFASFVLSAHRAVTPGRTAIGSALINCARLISNNEFYGKRRVIDLIGDGYNNSGIPPERVRDIIVSEKKIIINALAITTDNPQLDRYFFSRVIGGPSSFVMIASSFEGFAEAFKIKLLREVDGFHFALK